jgi:hypothetical protein
MPSRTYYINFKAGALLVHLLRRCGGGLLPTRRFLVKQGFRCGIGWMDRVGSVGGEVVCNKW